MSLDISQWVKITRDNTALLVIDMQVDFYSPEGRAAKRGRPVADMQKIAKKVSDFAQSLSRIGVFVVFTKFIADKGITPENLRRAVEKEGHDFPCMKGSGGEELYGVDLPDKALIIEKPHYDAFSYTNLNSTLKSRHVQNVLVCGVRTEICVDATAKRAASEGYDTFILSDLVATYGDRKTSHGEVLKLFYMYYGFVVSSKEVMEQLKI